MISYSIQIKITFYNDDTNIYRILYIPNKWYVFFLLIPINNITIRFLDTYKYLKNKKIVQTPKEFATEIGVSTSLITEICKKRTNAGLTPIQNLVIRFEEINSEWLLTGKGFMIKEENNIENLEDSTNYKNLADARLEIIETIKGKINKLNNEIIQFAPQSSKSP